MAQQPTTPPQLNQQQRAVRSLLRVSPPPRLAPRGSGSWTRWPPGPPGGRCGAGTGPSARGPPGAPGGWCCWLAVFHQKKAPVKAVKISKICLREFDHNLKDCKLNIFCNAYFWCHSIWMSKAYFSMRCLHSGIRHCLSFLGHYQAEIQEKLFRTANTSS